jgi:calcineurin-like phosphoesterase family protein
MKTWITSDLHFGHANIKKFCPETRNRFRDVEHMREVMISEWNESVAQEDLVYVLGDVAFLPAADAVTIMQRLHGRKILIEGNHDRKLLNDPPFRRCFESVHNYLRLIHNGQLVIMFHYPIAEWDQMHRGSVHFHGHLHGNVSGMEKYRCRDAGYDATGQIVWLMEDAIKEALKGEVKGHHV